MLKNTIQYLFATSFFNWLDIKVYTCINLKMLQWLTLKIVSFCIRWHSNSFPQFFFSPFIVLEKRGYPFEYKLWMAVKYHLLLLDTTKPRRNIKCLARRNVSLCFSKSFRMNGSWSPHTFWFSSENKYENYN